MKTDKTIEKIREKLSAAFSPTVLEVIDESYLHAGHAGAQTGKGHYAVKIHSESFQNLSPVVKHRMIYQELGILMETEIHALSIDAKGR